ncbi:MAG: aldehyde dehydrogenase family protein [Tepidisphaeraceae bacterium]
MDGKWRAAKGAEYFRAVNPASGEALTDEYPVSTWPDCDEAMESAANAATILRQLPSERLAQFLNRFAQRIEAKATEIVEMAHVETALPKLPRLEKGEMPRTIDQLRQAASAAAEGSWACPTIDSKRNIRSCFAAIGPVAVFGPNNFPLAFNGASGGDFAAAIAAGNPVIVKGHPSHPGTTRLFATEACAAIGETGLPPATVQLIYHMSSADGLRLVSDARLGATAFTGSRRAGLALKAAADAAGKPIYLEMSSLNPLVVLPGALRERADKIADEYADSCLAVGGQVCTKPGLMFLLSGSPSEEFILKVAQRFRDRPAHPLLSAGVGSALAASLKTLQSAGAIVVVGGESLGNKESRFTNTLLRIDGSGFLANPHVLQTEAFGNAALAVVARDVGQICEILQLLEGQLTGSIYSDTQGSDDDLYTTLSPILRKRVGRFLNDKMPTGVAVSAAMNHGGPYPATGHSGFTAVGIPTSIRRFSQLECYDNVRRDRLPALLADRNPTGHTWRLIDGAWSQADVAG